MTAASESRTLKLRSRGTLVATWTAGATPLISIELDGRQIATVGTVGASASLHWALTTAEGMVIGLASLAAFEPEDLDRDLNARAAALALALDAAASRLKRDDEGPPIQGAP